MKAASTNGRGALCTQTGHYEIRTPAVRLAPHELQELRLNATVLGRQRGPLPAAGFEIWSRLVAGMRVRCRKISDDGRVEWLPVVLRPAN